ncbi:MAG: cytochrome c [Planctomycetes bacterium]|nr:cytochrome c [Planctomycetota bacterium]
MTMRLTIPALLLVAAAAGLTGCRGDREDAPPRQFFPDLDDQLKWKPQTKSDFFADGRTMRQPVAGTVAFGTVGFNPTQDWAGGFASERELLLKDDKAFYEGIGADGKYLDKIPVPVTLEMVKLGQQKFNIYCSACHGYLGDGLGQTGIQWSYPLPNFHDVKYKKPDPKDPTIQIYKDGYIFHTARVGVIDAAGVQKMPGYAHALNEAEAWAVVAYFRALQASHEGTIQDVPESARPALLQSRGSVTAPAAAPTTPATPAATTPAAPTGGGK